MKFLKPMLLTAFAFLSISATVLFSACEKDSCSDLTCQNGGACSGGFCHCTTGYEGAQCEILSKQRFYGVYIGVRTCDNASGILDTVSIFSSATDDITSLTIVSSDNNNVALHGTISISGGQYNILVPNDYYSSGAVESYSIALNSNQLSFLTNTVQSNTDKSTCTFLGTK